MSEQKEMIESLSTEMIYITVSGEGLRFIYPRFEGCDILQSAVLYLHKIGLDEFLPKLDTSTTDITRLSILTKSSDYVYSCNHDDVHPIALSDDDKNYISSVGDVKTYLSNLRADTQKDACEMQSDAVADANDEGEQVESQTTDYDNRPYKSYSKQQIEANDRMYADFAYKGRKVSSIAECYVSYRTKGQGPELGERHALYTLLCKNFRNMVDNNPCILHAVLPSLNLPTSETWSQCCYFVAVNKSNMLPKDFWYWAKSNGVLDDNKDSDDDIAPAEDKFYEEMIKRLPPLPPIIKQYVDIAPKWFKIPTITTLQCYTALLCTNLRAKYFDGALLSTTLYQLVYAPAASGKGYVRRLKYILESTNRRDKLAIQKAKWYDQQQRQINGSKQLPEEIVWKQRIFASKTSLGEILKRQEAIGEHHWLQDVGEFSIWAATIKKAKEEWSAFFRTSYDNEEFAQSYQSSNAYRGKVAVYPIVHGTCTIGQINSFFTNVEDGLLTRFSFIPLLHQRFAKYQEWKELSDASKSIIDKTVNDLESETYEDKEDDDDWDYYIKTPKTVNLSFLYEPLLEWLEKKREEAQKSDNEALDTFRRRCARNAFIYGIICYGLFGCKTDKKTQKKIIDNMLWDADVKLFYMRYLWEEKMQDDLLKQRDQRKGFRASNIYEELPESFSRQTVENLVISKGYKTKASVLLCNWRSAGIIKTTSKNNFKKVK